MSRQTDLWALASAWMEMDRANRESRRAEKRLKAARAALPDGDITAITLHRVMRRIDTTPILGGLTIDVDEDCRVWLSVGGGERVSLVSIAEEL